MVYAGDCRSIQRTTSEDADVAGLRPTSDKLRETLFNILAPRVSGARVLDGYAGTGAIGIEALEPRRRARHLHRETPARGGADRGEPEGLRRRGRLYLFGARRSLPRSTLCRPPTHSI